MNKPQLAILVLSVTAALAVAAGSASAMVRNLGALPPGNTQPTGHILGSHTMTTPFSDTWNFTVLAPSNLVDSTVFNFNVPVHQNITGLNLELFDGTTLIASSPFGTGAPSEGLSIPTTHVNTHDHYSFVVSGTVPQNDDGVYDSNIFLATVGVPELGTWAMMLVGFALTALQVHRRNAPAVNAAA